MPRKARLHILFCWLACRWDDAIRVAESHRHADAEQLKRQHYTWLLETNQEERAAAVKERDGDYTAAIGLYMQGGMPARAAQVSCAGCIDVWSMIFSLRFR